MKISARVLVGIFFVVVVVFAFFPIANVILGKSIKDYALWFDTGQRVLHGATIYPPMNGKFPFMYPPPAALILTPFSLLGKTGLVVVLVLVNAVAWFASIILSVRLTTGNWKLQPALLYILPSIFIAPLVWSNFHLGQPSLFLLALLLSAFLALEKKKQLLAGVLVAIGAAIKAFPVVTIVYLIYRRYWLAAVSLLVALTFLLIALPTPVRGFAQARTDLQIWTHGMVFKYNEKGLAQRPGRGNSWKNQSIFGLTNRMLRHIDADDRFDAHVPFYANIADVGFRVVNGVILGAALLLGLIYLAVMPRAENRSNESNAIEWALLILLMLLFTPLAFGYLFAMLLFPFTIVVQRSLWLCGGIALALMALSLLSQLIAQTYGNYFFAALTLFLGLAVELWKMKAAAPTPPASAARISSPH